MLLEFKISKSSASLRLVLAKNSTLLQALFIPTKERFKRFPLNSIFSRIYSKDLPVIPLHGRSASSSNLPGHEKIAVIPVALHKFSE